MRFRVPGPMLGRRGLLHAAAAAISALCVLLSVAAQGAAPSAASPIDAGEVYEPGRRPRPDGPVVASVEAEQIARWNAGGASDPDLPSNRPGFHPAPRVHVSLDDTVRHLLPEKARATRGRLSRAAVLAQARNLGYWPFRLCYEDGLRRLPKLSGASVLHLWVARDGHVTKGTVTKSELQQSDVSQCLAEKARRLRFSPAPPRSFALSLVVDLHPGDVPLPDATPQKPLGPEQAKSLVLGAGLGVSEALQALAPARERVAECYSRATMGDSKLWGRLALLLDIDAKGGVTRAIQYETQFPAPGVVACAAEAARTAKFTAGPREGAGMRLVWALKLGAPATPAVTEPPATSPAADSPDPGASGSRDP